MTEAPLDLLPAALREIRTRPLFVMRLDVLPMQVVGAAPGGTRRIGVIPSGTFEGERLSGTVLEGGADWQAVRSDGSVTLDVRLVLKTKDDALIGVRYLGLRSGPPEAMARLGRGEAVDPSEYYFRIAPMFETAAPQYAWLNNVLAIGTGHRAASGPIYSVFEVL